MEENEWDDEFKKSEAATADERAGKSKLKFDEAELKKTVASALDDGVFETAIAGVEAAASAEAKKEALLNLGKIIGKVAIVAARKAITGGIG